MSNGIINSLKTIKRYYNAQKTSKYVKSFYKSKKHLKIEYTPNIWNKNYYWDYFLQSLPHSIKSKYYVPYDYYSNKIERILNDKFTSNLTDLKNLYDKLFNSNAAKLPKTYLRCMNGVYLDNNYSSEIEPNNIVKELGQSFVVKPGSSTYGGFGIAKYYYRKGNYYELNTDNIFDLNAIKIKMHGEFIIQETINQHPELAKYHPNSVNTLRIFTYRSIKTNKVVVPMSMLRIGKNNSIVDNASAGGICVGLTNKGELRKYALDQYGNYTENHPNTNEVFEKNVIPAYDKILDAAVILADFVPYQRLIGWDFSIDCSENPIFIELNTGVGTWMLQIANGEPLFGDYSNEIKEYITNMKNTQ